MSQHAYNIVSMTYHSIGSMNERLAMGAYTQMARTCDELGAGELSRSLFVPMRADEALHLGYYRTYALQLRQTLKNWQMAVVRSLIVHTYAPVGAGGKDDKAPFGECCCCSRTIREPSIAKAGKRSPRTCCATARRSHRSSTTSYATASTSPAA